MKKRIFGAGAASLMLAGSVAMFAAAPAGAAVTTVGTCGSSMLALGSAKSSTLAPDGKGYGISTNDNQDVAVATKGVDPTINKGTNLGSCTWDVFNVLDVPDNAKPVGTIQGTQNILKWGTKLYSREMDCNTADTADITEWPLSGALSITFTGLNPLGKNYAASATIVIDGFKDPNPSNPPSPVDASDVVQFHGIVSKGVAAGADVTGESQFDPTIADKTVTAGPFPTTGAYFGLGFDVLGAIPCTTGAPGANIRTFMNGSYSGVSGLLAIPVDPIAFTVGQP